MKKMLFIAAMTVLTTVITEARYNGSANFEVFYNSLAPYGEWIQVDYGYVWRPLHVRYGWRPYLYGNWVWSQYGWYWVSSEPFGWATFHYGRWQYDDYYGWIWVPDHTWGPAWVEWRYDDDYIGWAPLPPQAYFDVHVGISFRSHWSAPLFYWNFVTCGNFTRSHVVDYVQPADRSQRIFGRTRNVNDIRMVNNRIVNRGVDREFVEQRGRIHLNETEVVATERDRGERIVRDGGRTRIEAFRPGVDRFTGGGDSRPPNIRRAEREIRIEGMDRTSPPSQSREQSGSQGRSDWRGQGQRKVTRDPGNNRREIEQQSPSSNPNNNQRQRVERTPRTSERIERPANPPQQIRTERGRSAERHDTSPRGRGGSEQRPRKGGRGG